MNKNALKKLGILAACTFFISSCSESFDTSFFDKEIIDPELKVELPVGYVSYTAQELFEELSEDLTVGSTPDGDNTLISFTYSESLDGSGNKDFVNIDNQDITKNFKLLEGQITGSKNYVSGSIPGNQVNQSFFINEEIKDDGASFNEKLTFINFTSGTLDIILSTDTEAQTEVIVEIPTLVKKTDSSTFSGNFVLNSNSGNDTAIITVDLSEYNFNLTIDGFNPITNNGFNLFAVQLNTTVTFEAGDLVSDSHVIEFKSSIKNAVVNIANGDFKNKTFNVDNQSVNLDFFDELGDGTILFENPSLKISATNDFGFPIGLELDGISTNSATNNKLTITDNGSSDDNIILNGGKNYAVFGAGSSTDNGVTYTQTQTAIVLNNSNSNLADLLNEKPTEFNLIVSGVSNPSSPSGNSNFFNTKNNLNVNLDVEIPLHATFDNLGFSEIVDFDDAEDIDDNAKSITLDVRTINAMPLGGSITLEFLDASDNNLGINKSIDAFEACPVGNDGYSIGSIDANGAISGTIASTNKELVFTESEIQTLANTKKINIIVRFKSTDSNSDNTPDAIKLRTTDIVRLSLGLKGDVKFSDNE